jgi:hypothetical protein
VAKSVATPMHILKTLEAEVVLAIRAIDLRFLHSTARAHTSHCRLDCRVLLPRALAVRVEAVEARLAEGHQALVTLQCRLHHSAGLAWDLQVAELVVEQHVRLGEKQVAHGRLRVDHQQVEPLTL